MDFKDLYRVMRRRWRTIAAFFLLALVASAALSAATPRTYESTAKIFISVDTGDSANAYAASLFVPSRIDSYANLATHREVMSRVIGELDLDLGPQQLAEKVEAVREPDTVIINVTVTDGDPRQAQEIARAESETLVNYLIEIETPEGQTESRIIPTITDPASFEPDAVSPRVLLNLVVAALIGLLLGVAVAVARELLDNTMKSADDIERVTDAPVMGSVAADRTHAKQPLLTDIKGFSPRSEAFRMLRTNLQYLDLDHQPKSFVITSSVAGEGKTSVSVNLAIALAQAGRRVLLVDGDLRRPRVANLLGLERAVGLTTILVGRTKLEESIQRHAASGVHFLASGPTPPNPTEILQSHAAKELLQRLRAAYDVVLIDAPPVLPVADAAILGTAADGVVMVIRHGKTNRDQLQASSQRIEKVGARLFGVVVNMVPRRAAEGYYYYYYDEAPPEKARPKASTGSA